MAVSGIGAGPAPQEPADEQKPAPALKDKPPQKVSTTTSAPALANNDLALNKAEVKEVADQIVEAVDAPLATPKGRNDLAEAIEGDNTKQPREKVKKVVDEIADESVIGDLGIKVVDDGAADLGNADSKLLGTTHDATLLISDGLSVEEVGKEVQSAIVTLVEDVANLHQVELDRFSIETFFAPTVGAVVSYVTYHRMTERIYRRDREDAIEEEMMLRVAREQRMQSKH